MFKSGVFKRLKWSDLIWFVTLTGLVCLVIFVFYAIPVICALKNAEIFIVAPNGAFMLTDFSNIYRAGLMGLSHEQNVYDLATQLMWANKIIFPHHVNIPFSFQYPPYLFPLLSPVALVPPAESYILWNLLGTIFGMTGSFLLMKAVGWPRRQAILFMAIVALSYPSVMTWRQGQFTWWLFGAGCLYTWCLCKSMRSVLGGIILAISSIKPHYTIFLALPSLTMRRWSLVLTAVGCELLLILAAGITVGWSNVVNYPTILSNLENLPDRQLLGVFAEHMVSLRAVFALWFPTALGLKLSECTMLLGLCVALVIWLVVQKREQNFGPLHQWAMALTILINLISSPHCQPHDLLFLALPALLTMNVPDTKQPQRRSLWYRCWYALLLSFPVMNWLFFHPTILAHFKRLPNLVVMVCLLILGSMHFVSLVRRTKEASLTEGP